MVVAEEVGDFTRFTTIAEMKAHACIGDERSRKNGKGTFQRFVVHGGPHFQSRLSSSAGHPED